MAGNLQIVKLYVIVFAALHTGKYEQVVVIDLLLLVSKLQKILINLVEFLRAELDAEQFEPEFEGCVSASRCEGYVVVIQTDILRVNDFVGGNVLQHSVLVYSGRMSEGVSAYYCLVGLDRHIHQAGDRAAERVYLPGVDAGREIQVLVALDNHRDFLE